MSNAVPGKKKRSRWPLTTLIEILPVIIALTIVFSYTTIKGVSSVRLVTPLSAVLSVVPLWVVVLMSLITVVGVSGMVWLIYIFMRAPVAPDGSEADNS
ncbi:MAG: hypothetical protein R3A44_38185 [Caldilineaceae bacterium]